MKGEEMIYTFNLRRAYDKPRTKRAKVAVKLLKEFALRHAKADKVVVSNKVNGIIWSRGIKKPPRKVRVKLVKRKDVVYVLALDEEAPSFKEEKKEVKKKEQEKDVEKNTKEVKKSEKREEKEEKKEEERENGKKKEESSEV